MFVVVGSRVAFGAWCMAMFDRSCWAAEQSGLATWVGFPADLDRLGSTVDHLELILVNGAAKNPDLLFAVEDRIQALNARYA